MGSISPDDRCQQRTNPYTKIRRALAHRRVRSTGFQFLNQSIPSPISPPPGAPGGRQKLLPIVGTPLKLLLGGYMMLRSLKMPLRSQLNPNMTPTWPSLGPPEGPSDLCFTMVFFFYHFMFRFFIVLRGLQSPHRAQHRPHMGPKRGAKTTQMGI